VYRSEPVSNEEYEQSRLRLKNWINSSSKGEEGFTPMHFASFHGNIRLIRILIGHGGNIYAKNK
jgi:ankyrin repeat protein